MLKTIKIGFLLITAAAFLAGCASTSNTSDSDTSGTTTESFEPAVTSSSDSTAVDTTPAAPVVEQAPVLESVFYFDFDQSTLRSEARAALLAQAAYLKANPRSIRLEGHADERGTREYNIALGERRALAVRDFLRFEGVNSPIEVISYGEERPAVYGSGDDVWSLNRRVELK